MAQTTGLPMLKITKLKETRFKNKKMIPALKGYANHVFKSLGPGYNECVYHNAMAVSLRKHNIPYETERVLPIKYEDHVIGNLRADIIVDNKYILELKAVKTLNDSMKIQLSNYKKLTGISEGMVINFPQGMGCEECEFHTEDPPKIDI